MFFDYKKKKNKKTFLENSFKISQPFGHGLSFIIQYYGLSFII